MLTEGPVLVTGADGFVGRWVCEALTAAGAEVRAGVRDPSAPTVPRASRDRLHRLSWVAFDLAEQATIDGAVQGARAVIHLAAMASGAEARAQPVRAWEVNVLGTVRLLEAMERLAPSARLLFASSGEVYGQGVGRPSREDDAVAPCSPYAASKAAAEVACLESHRRSGLDVVVARPFAQIGPGQRADFVVPALARRMRAARAEARDVIRAGNLDPVREFIDVRDVAAAMLVLLAAAPPGDTVNIAAGVARPLREVARLLAEAVGWEGRIEEDPALRRRADLAMLVGDGGRLRRLGWAPRYALHDTLATIVGALDAPGEA
ncbi:MAG: GDP-mannose 4,6-dehydratase [Gemmatimonadales bacterium]|nr:GDP-mannose 4,6-dehydratase [Gemmatimonadales bacterium]